MADNFDKFRPDWTVGTLTLTGGSTAFTATNAELILAAIREGDAIITPTGFFLPIETLAEDGLSGTLSNPAPSASAGTFDTRIRYQSDNSRFTGALLALTRQLTGGNLQSFGNLEGLQDLMPIFLGPGSVGLINKSEMGIQDQNGSLGKLAALTLAARQILQTNSSGNLAAISLNPRRLLQTNVNGDISQVVLAANKFLRTDANADVAQGDLTTFGAALLGLTGAGGHLLTGVDINTIRNQQIAVYGGAVQTENLPIINGNTTSSGTWIRFLDGTQICLGQVASGTRSTTSVANGLYRTDIVPFPFPSAFIATPWAFATIDPGNGWLVTTAGGSATTVNIRWMNLQNVSAGAATATTYWIAIGRWK